MANNAPPSFLLGAHGDTEKYLIKSTGPISLRAAGAQLFTFDFTAVQQQSTQFLDCALSMYVDNGDSATKLVFTFQSGQVIEIDPHTAGYVTILQPNPIQLTVATSGATDAYFMLINKFLPTLLWTASAL